MKPTNFLIFLLLLSLTGFISAVDTIELKNPIKFDRELGKNKVFFKWCDYFDIADGYFYFLESQYSMVFKVERGTGKLAKTISSRGEGPSELKSPVSIRVRNQKIFVLDKGFNGVKVFDTDGNTVKEFKFDFVMGFRNIDVNEKEEIFLGRVDRKNNTMVQVYNINGKKLRSLIPFEKNIDKVDKIWHYTVRLDQEGNIYLLFFLERRLAKYDKTGKLLWETPIKNKLLALYAKDDEVKRTKNNKIQTNQRIFGINITPKGSVIVAHAGGGSMFSADGNLKKLITTPGEEWSLCEFKIIDDKLINVAAFGQYVNIYQFKEEYQ